MRKKAVGAFVGGAAVGGLGSFAVAMLVVAGMPDEGHARLEAVATAFVALGGTLIGAAVAVSAVLLTLGLQRQVERERQYAEFQTGLIRESLEWISSVQDGLGGVLAAIEEARESAGMPPAVALSAAEEEAQGFRTQQDLGRVERLELLVDDSRVRQASLAPTAR